MAPRETENNAYAKFWGDKQRALWYVMAFLEWSIIKVNQMLKSVLTKLHQKNSLLLQLPTASPINKAPISSSSSLVLHLLQAF